MWNNIYLQVSIKQTFFTSICIFCKNVGKCSFNNLQCCYIWIWQWGVRCYTVSLSLTTYCVFVVLCERLVRSVWCCGQCTDPSRKCFLAAVSLNAIGRNGECEVSGWVEGGITQSTRSHSWSLIHHCILSLLHQQPLWQLPYLENDLKEPLLYSYIYILSVTDAHQWKAVICVCTALTISLYKLFMSSAFFFCSFHP